MLYAVRTESTFHGAATRKGDSSGMNKARRTVVHFKTFLSSIQFHSDVLQLPLLIVSVSATMLVSIPKSITRLSPPKAYPNPDKLIGLGLIFLFIFSWSSFLNGNVFSLSMSRIPAEPIRNSTLGVSTLCIVQVWLPTTSNSSKRSSRWRFLTEKTERSLYSTLQRQPTLPSLF